MRTPKSSSGTSLVEVMVAVLLLAVLATGGAAFLFQSRSQVVIQENRRSALEVANGRMEELRATPYNVVKPPKEDDNLWYQHKDKVTGIWLPATKTDPQETIEVNGQLLPITTTVRYMDADGGSKSRDLLKIQVQVGYRLNNNDRVTLESLYSQ